MHLHRAGLVVATAVLLALGVVLGFYSGLLSLTGPRIGTSQPFSLGLLVAAAGNPLAVWLGLVATRSKALAAAPLLAWVVVILLFSSSRSAGSVVLAGGPFQVSSAAVTFGGLVTGVAALLLLTPAGRLVGRRAPERAGSTRVPS